MLAEHLVHSHHRVSLHNFVRSFNDFFVFFAVVQKLNALKVATAADVRGIKFYGIVRSAK